MENPHHLAGQTLPLGVENIELLEGLDHDRDGRVDGIRYDENKGFGCVLGNTLCKAFDNAGVDLKIGDSDYEIIRYLWVDTLKRSSLITKWPNR